MEERKKYYLRDMLDFLGVKKPTFEQWLYFISPHIKAKGTGTRNIFSLEDVFKFSVFKSLIQGGLSRKEAARFANAPLIARMRGPSLFRLYSKIWDSDLFPPLFLGFIKEKGNLRMILLDPERFATLLRNHPNLDTVLVLNMRKIWSNYQSK